MSADSGSPCHGEKKQIVKSKRKQNNPPSIPKGWKNLRKGRTNFLRVTTTNSHAVKVSSK